MGSSDWLNPNIHFFDRTLRSRIWLRLHTNERNFIL